MKFRNKTILIVSQQDWGKMFISKHHYALCLARLGNQVYFLNSPTQTQEMKPGEIVVSATQFENLHQISHKFFYPYLFKFKAKPLHRLLLKWHLKNVINKIGGKVDIVWSFDISDTVSMRSFPSSCYKIFMPVDEPSYPDGIAAAKTADVIFSVTNEILDKYSQFNVPKLFTNHGVSSLFIKKTEYVINEGQLKIGLSGNFLRPDLDWTTLLKIIDSNSNVEFSFWGPMAGDNTNLLDKKYADQNEYPDVKSYANVKAYGTVSPEELAQDLYEMDGFLICYDIEKDQSGGTNYHKVLEYMATGRVIISNNITTYADTEGLVEMPVERNNEKLPELFSHVINNIRDYNSEEKQVQRMRYASSHTYEGNILTIENFITETEASV